MATTYSAYILNSDGASVELVGDEHSINSVINLYARQPEATYIAVYLNSVFTRNPNKRVLLHEYGRKVEEEVVS